MFSMLTHVFHNTLTISGKVLPLAEKLDKKPDVALNVYLEITEVNGTPIKEGAQPKIMLFSDDKFSFDENIKFNEQFATAKNLSKNIKVDKLVFDLDTEEFTQRSQERLYDLQNTIFNCNGSFLTQYPNSNPPGLSRDQIESLIQTVPMLEAESNTPGFNG